ncbi:MAG: efflux RND transporter permease subunit, partial [Pseudorhodoplanes sp.]
VYLYVVVPKGFFPTEDTGFISVTVEGPADISFRAMLERQQQVASIIQADPAIAYVNSTVGVGGPNSTNNTGRLFISLKPKKERDPSKTVIARLRKATENVIGMRVFFRDVQNINLGGRITTGEWQYTLQSSDTDALYHWAPLIQSKIAEIQGLRDINSDLYISNPQVTVEVDRQKAATYGISVDQVRQELYNAYGTRQVATIYTPANDYQIILETKPEFQIDTSGLDKLYLKTSANPNAASSVAPGGGVTGSSTPSGLVIPLSAVTKLVPNVGPLQVNHQGQQPAVTISFNLQPGMSIGPAQDAIKQVVRESGMPSSIITGFQGNAQVFEDAKKGQGILVLAAIFAAYVILGILYESFIHPITIISGLPSAGIGAIVCLMLFGMDLSVIAMIGVVMLVGIVKKNAIMMIDFALERRRVGLGAEAAIREACLLRFRPIMMTTFAAIFGVLPIALGTGAGAELRQPLGIAVVGGLCVSQLLTLFITPVIYVYLDGVDRMLRRRLEPQVEAVDGPVDRPHAVAAE